MKISDYLRKEYCIMDLKSTTKQGAIKEISDFLSLSGKVRDKNQFVKDILERESLGSTGIGHKIAIPHSRTAAVESFIIGFGRASGGIDFNALDGDKVNLIFLMGANPGELNLYLRLLAELSRFLMENSFRKALLEAPDAEEIINIFKKFEGI
ncbi:MAG: PTS sugar transporter subunit IIA [Candidatus Omnitrophica bacterium]|nr:PTS sugar transporter subunit IIA [Candidatus Omnitrophota bacterium]